MSTVVTKFEALLPTDILAQTSVATFLDAIGAIVPFEQQQMDMYIGSTGAPVQKSMIFGLLTSTQTTAALSALNTLNASLIANGDTAIVCYSYPVTLQP